MYAHLQVLEGKMSPNSALNEFPIVHLTISILI